jgi:hypothetical protein
MQQGQVFELTTRAREGGQLWAYRFRVGGRGSKRIQRGGFASEQDAREALERELERVRRERRIPRSLTLAELVESTSPNTTYSRSRSRSCAGCSPRRQPSSASVASAS